MSINDDMEFEITEKEKVEFLRNACSYPQPCSNVDVIETHMSWVFLTEESAYKLKKIVLYDYLDFRKIESRHFFCKEEIRLNQRLSNNVYQNLIPLCKDEDGNLNLTNEGIIIDWLVKMRRLSKSLMLDYAIKNKCLRRVDVVRIVKFLVKFYQRTASEKITIANYLQSLRSQILLNKKIMEKKIYDLPKKIINNLCSSQHYFIKRNITLFEKRIIAGNLKEGHGDLRPEHICLEEPISIIDCLEFSKYLRLIDTADEISFLAMECEKIDAPEIAKIILSSYTEISGDNPPPSLLHFYQSLRAAIRARIAISHLDEEKFRASVQWKQRACDYLILAEQHQASANSLNDSLP
jgi:aminoglycoside phosphotransferase family enzyme